MTIRYQLGCDLSYEIRKPTTFIFNFEVARLMRHHDLVESLSITPDSKRRTYVVPDVQNRYVSINADPGPLNVRYDAEVTLDVFRADPGTIEETPLSEIPLDIMPFLLPSRFVPSDRLAPFAQREFGNLARGHQRVTAICNWIYDNLEYRRGSSNEQTTATESLLLRAGVCRDFSHLGIAFCRALDIPARFVSCYAYGLEPRDFHAVFECFLSGRWWLFDATRQANLDGLVRIAVRRDGSRACEDHDRACGRLPGTGRSDDRRHLHGRTGSQRRGALSLSAGRSRGLRARSDALGAVAPDQPTGIDRSERSGWKRVGTVRVASGPKEETFTKNIILAAALLSAASGQAFAQTTTTDTKTPAVATSDTKNSNAPVEGKNCFTEE